MADEEEVPSPEEMEDLEKKAKRLAKRRARLEAGLLELGVFVPPEQQFRMRMELLLDVCLPPGSLDRAQFDVLAEEMWCDMLRDVSSKATQKKLQGQKGGGGALLVPDSRLVVPGQ